MLYYLTPISFDHKAHREAVRLNGTRGLRAGFVEAIEKVTKDDAEDEENDVVNFLKEILTVDN